MRVQWIGLLSRRYQRAVDHISTFKKILGTEKVRDNDIDKYRQDWTKFYQGGSVVCFPSTTQEVAEILRYCNDNDIGVVPQGAYSLLCDACLILTDSH